jgi:hypothetical protein
MRAQWAEVRDHRRSRCVYELRRSFRRSTSCDERCDEPMPSPGGQINRMAARAIPTTSRGLPPGHPWAELA